MNKLVYIIIAVLGVTTLQAQDLSSSKKQKIKEGVSVEIQQISRVEKYGWDNLEVKYIVQNNSDYDIRKLDFTIRLLDGDQKEVGTIDVHAFNLPKSSEQAKNYFDVGSEYVNASISDFTSETTLMDVVVDNGESIVSIKGTELVQR